MNRKGTDAPVFRHVLCVYPYRYELGPRDWIYPPLGIEIIAARLAPYCRSIDVIDLRRESKRTTDFLRPDTDLVCFSVMWDLELESVREEIRSVPRGIRTVVGGQYASREPERWLSDCPNVDILARGGGEDAVRDLAEGLPPERIAGISYRLDGRLVHNPVQRRRALPDDFAPNRTLRRYAYSFDWPGLKTGVTFDTVASSVGCAYNCAFCSFNRDPWGERIPWSARSPESVARELAGIDADIVGFVDLDFTHDMDRAGAIAELILQRGIRKRYVAEARLEAAKRPDVLKKMARAGFSVLLIGIESASDKTLRAMRKGFTTGQARRYGRVLRRSPMILHATFILGYPGESEADMLRIVPFARELGVDTLNLCLLRSQLNPGLPKLIARTPGYHIAPDGNVFSDRYPPEHLSRLRDRMLRSFYTPGQIFRLVRKAVKNRLLVPPMLPILAKWAVRAVARRLNPGDEQGPFALQAIPGT